MVLPVEPEAFFAEAGPGRVEAVRINLRRVLLGDGAGEHTGSPSRFTGGEDLRSRSRSSPHQNVRPANTGTCDADGNERGREALKLSVRLAHEPRFCSIQKGCRAQADEVTAPVTIP